MDSNISYDEFVLINNVLREHEDMKEEIISLSKILFYLWINVIELFEV